MVAVNWVSIDPSLHETLLARGDAGAIPGCYFTRRLKLEAHGIQAEALALPLTTA